MIRTFFTIIISQICKLFYNGNSFFASPIRTQHRKVGNESMKLRKNTGAKKREKFCYLSRFLVFSRPDLNWTVIMYLFANIDVWFDVSQFRCARRADFSFGKSGICKLLRSFGSAKMKSSLRSDEIFRLRLQMKLNPPLLSPQSGISSRSNFISSTAGGFLPPGGEFS